MKDAQKLCRECNRRLIEVSNIRGVRYWEKKLKQGGHRLMEGFTQVGENLIRITHQSPITAEVWGREFPLQKRHRRTFCPKCMGRYLQEKGIRKEAK